MWHWERSVVANRVREDGRGRGRRRLRSGRAKFGRQERINRTDNGAIQRTLNKSQKKEPRKERMGEMADDDDDVNRTDERTGTTRHLLLTSLSDRQRPTFFGHRRRKSRLVRPSIYLSIQRVS